MPSNPRSMEEGLEMRGDFAPPSWLDKLEEAQYSLSKWVIGDLFPSLTCNNESSFQDSTEIGRVDVITGPSFT